MALVPYKNLTVLSAPSGDAAVATNDNFKALADQTDSLTTGKEGSIASGDITQYWRGDKTWQALNTFGMATFYISYAVVGTNLTNQLIVPANATLVKAFACAKTAPVGSDLIFDIYYYREAAWTSLWAEHPENRLVIADGASSGTTVSFDTPAILENDLIRIDIVSPIPSTTPGSDITVQLKVLY